jgi:hypothetical protein
VPQRGKTDSCSSKHLSKYESGSATDHRKFSYAYHDPIGKQRFERNTHCDDWHPASLCEDDMLAVGLVVVKRHLMDELGGPNARSRALEPE